MRTRVREQVRPDASAAPAQTPVRDLPVLRDTTTSRAAAPWRRAAPLTAEDTALPGRMLMLLSRLHRNEMQRIADLEAAAPSQQGT
ncbi:hypothetical protein [Methylobacterium sp. 17Sr1-1]|uniref:hypothetical protein n=1 Tax=Methylobacterium sp. 17Sr1-1 TaxID=2202826 RepID=UPI000D6F2CBF|nr:hypothetical protein [Methylobacterium sp. 17Sr1-1]AWN50706.1 hypothetical protein DK412_02350 [Methylobacterium sp. 17Sr1-1]